VFVLDDGTWVQYEDPLLASDGAPGDQFGHAVSISGDNVVVGSRFAATVAAGTRATTTTGALYLPSNRFIKLT